MCIDETVHIIPILITHEGHNVSMTAVDWENESVMMKVRLNRDVS